MPLAKSKKHELVAEIKDQFEKNGMAIFAEFKSQKVSETSDMRNKLHDGSVRYKVYKNTLVKQALKELGADDDQMKLLAERLKGQLAMAYSADKPLEAAKLMSEFAKGSDKLTLKCGFFEKRFLEAAGVEGLGTIGSKEMLIGRLVMALKSPVSRLANALQSPQAKLAYALSAVAEQKGKNG